MHVVLICSNPVLGRLVLPSLRRMGATCHLICAQEAAHLRWSRCCDGVLMTSENLAAESPERIADVINRLGRKRKIDSVLASDVPGLLLLARAKDRLDCPVFPVSTADLLWRLNNKWQFHRLCQEAGVEVPRTLHFPSKQRIDTEQAATSIGFPAVVKPIEQWSGTGVQVVTSAEALTDAVIRNEAYPYQEVVVQEFVPGLDAGFGGLAEEGRLRCWTTFVLDDAGAAESRPLPKLYQAAERLIAGLRFTGVIYLDVRLDPASGAVKFLECNPRFFVRVRAARLFGLDFVRAGLAPDGTGADSPPSLTGGNYLPLGSLLSVGGWRRIAAGQWSAPALLRTLAETLSDPVPTLIEALRPRGAQDSVGLASSLKAPG